MRLTVAMIKQVAHENVESWGRGEDANMGFRVDMDQILDATDIDVDYHDVIIFDAFNIVKNIME